MMWWIMLVYQYVLTFCDFMYLVFQSIYITFESLYRFIDPPKMKSVVGENILITGAGHGIGREMSLQLARLGAKIICLDLNEEWNKQTVAMINKEGGTAWGFWCDVSKREEVKDVSDKIRRTIGDIYILVNNVGIMPCKPMMRHSPEEIEKIFKVNVYSQIWMIQEWLPTFQANKRGHFVGMSSMCGLMGTPNLVPYCASKFAVTGLMEALNEELRYGEQNPNIKCTRVHPYTVDTGLAKNPRVKFPSMHSVVKTEKCVERIIQGVRREEDIIFIPPQFYYTFKLVMPFPRKFHLALVDFLDTGVDPDDS